MTQKIQFKIDNTLKFALQTFEDFSNNNYDNCLNNARKACEAICRAFILKKYGDINGEKIILGEVKKNLTANAPYPDGKYKVPLLNDLLKICEQDFDKALYFRFQDIRYGGNNASHDPINIKNEITIDDVNLCLTQFKEIIKWFWKDFLTTPLPKVIVDAFDLKVDKTFLWEFKNSEWERFYIACNCFTKEHNFILIAPPNYQEITENQLSTLSRIHWRFIIDFDPKSKETGLFHVLENEIHGQQIHPITIEQKEQKDRLVSNSFFALNWYFANGLIGLPSTISNSERTWRNLRYASFTNRLINEYLNQRSDNYTLIFLLDNLPYIRTIIQSFDEHITNQNNVNYIIVHNNDNFLPRFQEFEQYNAVLIKLSISELIEGVRRTILPLEKNLTKNVFLVPARDEEDEIKYIDLGMRYLSFLEKSIEILYQGITNVDEVKQDSNSFYKGNLITWDELALEFDVRRNKKEVLINKVNSFLIRSKGGYSVELQHKPGAGGTTLSRRIAYEFHQQYPTIIISKYIKDKTNQALFELAEFTQRPILAIVEAYQVTQNELNLLIRKVNEDKKHVVFLYVIRKYKSNIQEVSNSISLSEKTVDFIERDRFISRYTEIASSLAKSELKKFAERNPSQCEIIDFALTAYEDDFSATKLDNYITNYLEKLPASQLKFVCYGSIFYYYTQKKISENWYSKLFYNNSLSDELALKPFDERYISKLFINEFDFDSYENTNFWRPRFNRFAYEIIRNQLHKDNWKSYLCNYSIDLLNDCRSSNQFLSDDLREAIKSLFLNRDNEDVLGIDENYESAASRNRQFAQIIRDIAHKEQQILVFKALVDNYPDEAHFRGHYGRFLYETAVEPKEFEEAEAEIFKAIEFGEGDYNLWHIKGMCNRRKIEYLIRQNFEDLTNEEIDELEGIIHELTEIACEDFEKSRQINPYNLHSHTSQIQLLIKVIGFGQTNSGKSKELFITDEDKIWYKNKISGVDTLIYEAQYIIDLSKDLEQSKTLKKSKTMIEGCEGRVFGLLGDFSQAIDRFRQLSESSERTIRPYFRKMFVYSTLASKVGNIPYKFKHAWNKLSDYEFETLKKALESNIREQPENIYHIKLWLQAVRFTQRYLSIDECINTVKMWFDNSVNLEISHLEASYYLYVLYACKAISEGEGYSLDDVKQAKSYLNLYKDKNTNDRFSFEWYGNGRGIKHVVNHSQLGSMSAGTGFFEDVSLLAPVLGTIVRIDDRRKGYIKIDNCGLDAFFVPSNGGFEKGNDETEKVKFYVGFRYNGLVAWNVQRIEITELVFAKTTEVDIEGFDLVDETVENNQIEVLVDEVESQEPPQIFNDVPHLPGLTIVGKMDLSAFEKYKKKKK